MAGNKCFVAEPTGENRTLYWDDGSKRGTAPIYRHPETGETFTSHELPPGAMLHCTWHEPNLAGPDGQCWGVMTPGGFWVIDAPSSNAPKCPWTRTGAPPNLTVHPSIAIGDRYHGWLRDGYLEEC